MSNYFHVIFFSLIGGLFSLFGGYLLLSRKKLAENLVLIATPFAAGALLGAAFFELLPESIGLTADGAATRWALAGIVVFFVLEHFLQWFHHHHEHEDKKLRTTVPLIIIGDSIHNLLDGIAIGSAFLINVPTGIVASLAVAAHEIPQEIGDFGLLLKAGMSKKKVIRINIMSALLSVVGAVLTFWLGNRANLPVGELLAITAGMFIYIAASDLLPSLHESHITKRHRNLSVILVILGILIVGLATELAHEFIDNGHSEETGHSVEADK